MSGSPTASSATVQPSAHTSAGGPYSMDSSTSGARYLRGEGGRATEGAGAGGRGGEGGEMHTQAVGLRHALHGQVYYRRVSPRRGSC